jgi:ribosomal silencing factor RsfS
MTVRLEGTSSTSSSSTWAMVDGGKVVIHILNEESRKLYDLESVWKHPSSSSSSSRFNQNLDDHYS